MRFIISTLCLILLIGCTPLRPSPKVEKPYHNLEGYKKGEWILLAESKTKYWYYDPKTLFTQDQNVIEFTMFWAPKFGAKPSLIKGVDPSIPSPINKEKEVSQEDSENAVFSKEFNTGAIGPFQQVIDCSAQYQFSERPDDQACDISALGGYTPTNLQPRDVECWVPIKQKTAMLMIAGRICGRPLPLKKLKNYFLYQEGQITTPALQNKTELESKSKAEELPKPIDPIFYDVFNNEYIVIDSKQNIREMKISSQSMTKKDNHVEDFIFRANCQNKTASIYTAGSPKIDMKSIGPSTSLTGVAFDRVCGNHDDYMNQVKRYSE